MRTKLVYILTLASLTACDPDSGADVALELDALDAARAPEPLIATIVGACDRSDVDCTRVPELLEDLDRGEVLTDEDALVQLENSCPNNAPEPCSALSLFEGTTSETSHLLSLEDHPATNDYSNTPPDNGDKIWIMGDWDGDGVESPGYYSKGRFRFTDDPDSPTNSWSPTIFLHDWNNGDDPTWPLVAGRFAHGFASDCVGVIIDSGLLDMNGLNDETYYLEYRCDLWNSKVEGAQWIGAVLPKSSFPAGVHQFAAGDWDGDNIDEIAIRKDKFIAYSVDDPDCGPATFPKAQRWGVPEGELPETGMFVSGDWNGDGIDGWGVLYDDNHFYYRSDLAWNPGPTAYYWQHIDTQFSNRSVSSHH